MATSSYERLSSKKIDVSNLLQWHFTNIVKSINRRLSFRQKFKNPWTVELTEIIHRDLFVQAFIAIRDFPATFGRVVYIEKDKKGVSKKYTITFTHLGCMRHHLHKLSGIPKTELDSLFSKESKKGIARIVVNAEKKGVIVYDCKNNSLKFNICYEVTNRYGVVCSFA